MELLVRMVDKTDNPGLIPNRKRFDVVTVQEDGWLWGKKERPPTYLIVKVPGVTVEEALFLMEPDLEDDLILIDPDTQLPRRHIVTRSAWGLRQTNIPPPLQAIIDTAMIAAGFVTIAEDVFRAITRRKGTNETPVWGRKTEHQG